MVERISTQIVFMLFDASLKAILLWAVAMLAIRTFRRMSVHEQHRVWTVVLLGLLTLPILAHAGPTWSLPIGLPAVSADHVKSEPTSTDSGAGDLNGQIAVFPGRSRNAHGQDSPSIPSADIRVGHVRNGGLPSGTASIERDSASQAASPVAGSLPRWYVHRSSLLLLGSMVWLTGVGAMLVRLLIAVFRTLRIKRAAVLVTDCFVPAGMVVRECRLIESPAVVGWWQPCILLPPSWREWPDAKRAAVFSHEQSHLRRRDTSLSLLAELVTLFYWFHPVSWWTKRQLSRLAELACDEAAAIALGDRLVYARYLVEIAAANRKNSRLQSATAMARSSEVGPRVRALLDLSRPLTVRASRSALAAILLVGIPVVILLAALRPTRANTSEQGTTSRAAARPQEPAASPAKAKPVTERAKVAPVAAVEQAVLSMRGTVFLPDGSVAKEAVLEQSPDNEPGAVLSATITTGQFEIRTTGTNLMPAGVLFRTPDWSFQALLVIQSRTLRSECAAPKRINLAPARVITVKVTDGDRIVAACHVQVSASLHKYLGITRADGVANLKIAHDGTGYPMVAWSDDQRIGGFWTAPKPNKNPAGTEFHIEISHGEPVRVRVVDARQEPVANVPLAFTAVPRGQSGWFVGDNPTSRQTTNASGEAVFAWVPNWPKESISVRVAENSPWREARDRPPSQPADGVRQLEVAASLRALTNQRVTVTGQLSGPATDVAGLLIEFLSDPGEDDEKWDAFFARCDANGRFRAQVLPGNRYKVFVDDRDLVSNLWDGVIADSTSTTTRTPKLTVKKGVPVEVRVTKGRDQKPTQNVYVFLEESHQSKIGTGFWGETDEHGRFVASVAPGELKVRVNDGDWNQEKTIQIVEGKAAKIHLHRQYPEKQTIRGRLVLPLGATADQSNTTVTIAGMDGESEDTTTVTSDARGRFLASISAGRISILASSAGEDYFGCGIVDVREGEIEIPMHPTIRYEGRVLGSEGKPLSGITVHLMARLFDRGREYPPGTPDFRKQYVELFGDRIVVTDAKGYFVIPKTPQRMELTIWLTRPGETVWAHFAQKYLEPGQTRPPETIRIGPDKPKPLELELSDTLRDCRLAGIHALVVVVGAGDLVEPFIKAHLFDPEETGDDETEAENHDIYSYLRFFKSGPEAAKLPDRRASFAARNWPFPEPGSLFLAAINGDGKELGRLSVNVTNDQAAKEVAGFIKTHLPKKRDARAGYEAALAEAKRSDRRVWVRVGETRCAPCFSFSRWLDSQRDLLAKDYVLFKFDDGIDINGEELSRALKFYGQGVPCHAILEADGKELINSIGPLGNIGDPSGSSEARRALAKDAEIHKPRNLSDADIESLIRSLPKE